MNKVILLGRLTRDPDMRSTAKGTAVASFSLAVNRRVREEVDFFSIVAYDKTAEFAQKYTVKGQQIVVCGRLQNRSYEDKEGKTIHLTEVIADELYFADSKKTVDKPVEDVDLEHIVLSDDDALPF